LLWYGGKQRQKLLASSGLLLIPIREGVMLASARTPFSRRKEVIITMAKMLALLDLMVKVLQVLGLAIPLASLVRKFFLRIQRIRQAKPPE